MANYGETCTLAILLEASLDFILHPMSKTYEDAKKEKCGVRGPGDIRHGHQEGEAGLAIPPGPCVQLLVLPHKRELGRGERAYEMAQWIKALAAKAGDLSSIPETHVVKGD